MANLFSIANKIRKVAGYNNMTQAEAIALAKKQLAKENTPEIKVGQMFKTESGLDAKVVCFTRGQMLVRIMSRHGSYNDRTMKYNLDGTSPFASNLNGLRLVMTSAA